MKPCSRNMLIVLAALAAMCYLNYKQTKKEEYCGACGKH